MADAPSPLPRPGQRRPGESVPTVIPISHPGDPRLEVFRRLRDRDVVGRDGGFIAEGEVVVRALARGALHQAECLLLAERRVNRLAPVIARLGPRVAVYSASQAVMDEIVGFPIHRGILAFGRRGRTPDAGDLLAELEGPAIVLALFGIANHDNMGGILRNAAAFGARAVLLGADCCDPFYRKAIRVSVGAALTLPIAHLTKTSCGCWRATVLRRWRSARPERRRCAISTPRRGRRSCSAPRAPVFPPPSSRGRTRSASP
jgi:tRNA G18 (ribose-2'-O)-methylase SpoU